MHRKITRTGPATLTIALPAKWIKKHQLQAGEELKLTELDSKLILSIADEQKTDVARLPYDPMLLSDMLEKVYRENVSRIQIHAQEAISKNIVRKIAKFPGLQIVDETPTKIEIQKVLQPSLVSSDTLLRRGYVVLKQSFDSNPSQLGDLEQILFLISLQRQKSREHELLSLVFTTLSSLTKPVYDELYGYLRSFFTLVYKQKYTFSKLRASEIEKMGRNLDTICELYAKKESALVIAKCYHLLQLFRALHKLIITEQSIRTLTQQENTSRKKYLVGVCLKNRSNKFWYDYVQSGMVEAQKSFSQAQFIYRMPNTYPDIEAQKQILQEFIEMGVDAIVLAPNHPTKLEPLLKKIHKAGIKLIIIDTELTTTVEHHYIGWDNSRGGELTAKFLNKKLKKNASVLIVEGEKEGNFHDRVTGFKAAFQTKLVTTVQGDFQQSIAYKKTLTFLKKNTVDAIFATSDNMSIGVLQALTELGLKIPVCGFDATQEVRDLIGQGSVLSTIDTKPRLLGASAVETAQKILRNKPVSKKVVYDVELIC